MDYKKKYNEAQKWIESIYSELSHEHQMEAEAFFPELKESEDEKMMHQLHSWMKEFGGAEEYTEKVYTWLKSLLEKQGEQKPVDKVEPKFKVGDWVVTSYGKVNQVIAVDEDGDGFTLDDDTYFSGSWKDGYHLWTIQDAKDGDVIVASDGSLFILAKVKDNSAYYHFSLWKNGSKEISDGNHSLENAKGCHPATKEQRTELFLKMHEAGYEWDAEKKELKNGNFHIESTTEALRMEYEKGRADVLHDIDPDEMVADFCSQPLSKTRSLASIYRQGIIDIIKRINRNEETSITSTRSIDDVGL